jgi:hypothetical protein
MTPREGIIRLAVTIVTWLLVISERFYTLGTPAYIGLALINILVLGAEKLLYIAFMCFCSALFFLTNRHVPEMRLVITRFADEVKVIVSADAETSLLAEKALWITFFVCLLGAGVHIAFRDHPSLEFDAKTRRIMEAPLAKMETLKTE